MDEKPIVPVESQKKPQEKTQPEEKDFTYKSSYRSQVLPSCTLELSHFKKLYEILKTATDEGADIEIAKVKKTPGQSDEDFESFKKLAKTIFKVSIHIFGSKGEYIFSESPSMLDDAGLPDTITKMTFDNTSKFRASLQQREPINKFRIEFDFTKQKIFDLISTPSEATPNKSYIYIQGESDTWVSGAYNKVMEFLQERSNKHGWLHRNNIYDMFLYFLIIPLTLRLIYNINHSLPARVTELSAFFKAACYLYFFIVTLNIFRIIFNYTRWIFPNTELIQRIKKGAVKHRYILGVILLGITAAFIYDMIKLLCG